MHDHRVADLDVGDAGADLVHPARVLVAGRVGEDDLGLLGPLPLLDVEVGAAQPGGADLHDDVERPGRLGLVDLVELERLVVLVQSGRVHAATSSGSWMSYRTASSERQMPPLASRLVRTSLAIRSQWRQLGRRDRRAVGPDERRRVVVDRDAQVLAQLEAATRAGIAWEVGHPARSHLLGRRAAGQQLLAEPRLARDERLALEQLAQRVELTLGLAGEGVRRTPRLGRRRR